MRQRNDALADRRQAAFDRYFLMVHEDRAAAMPHRADVEKLTRRMDRITEKIVAEEMAIGNQVMRDALA